MTLHGSQRAAGLFATVIVGCIASTSIASGATVRSSENFTVLAPSARLADMVVVRAEAFRSRIGAAWLGGVLPATRTPTAIFVHIDPAKSFARTLVDPDGEHHMVWLVGSEQAVTKYLLAHEVAHVVFAGRFGDGMPVWANEGIASRYDNERRQQIRARKLSGFVDIDSWPQLDRLFEQPIRQHWQYAAAVSVTEYLVQLKGRQEFIEFVTDSQSWGCDRALTVHYGIESVTQLQGDWQQAVRASVRQTSRPMLVATSAEAASAHSVR